MTRGAALATLLLAACRPGHAALADCSGNLSGVWRADADHAFDVRDHGASLELYAMWNTATPTSSPWRVHLAREAAGADPAGSLTTRVTTPTGTCKLDLPARLHACRGARATLELAVPRALDPTACVLAATPEHLVYTLERP
jgi:hypothetical protein